MEDINTEHIEQIHINDQSLLNIIDNRVPEIVEELEEKISEDKDDYSKKMVRFKDAEWFNHFFEITIGGAGGIGSHLSMLLSRLGHKLTVYDFDTVSVENLGGQAYREHQIGNLKVDCLNQLCQEFCGNNEFTFRHIDSAFNEESEFELICFSCFDNMEARKIMFEKWAEEAVLEENINTPCVFIDGRLLYGNLQIYVVTKDNIQQYRDCLFDSSEVPTEQCTLKVTTHYAYIIAGWMTSSFTNYLSNFLLKSNDLPIPFLTRMELQSNYHELQY